MYYVYILRCSDNSLYTGITTDVERRFEEHKSKDKKGAKYTRAKSVVSIAAVWERETRSDALKLEAFIKKQRKEKKETFIKSPSLLANLCISKKEGPQPETP